MGDLNKQNALRDMIIECERVTMDAVSTNSSSGRSCPLHYRYLPSVFAREPDLHADTIYVVGGLYGNQAALDSVLEMLATESGHAALVFNGDFNWFNIDASSFAAINTTVLSHYALRGNVETELASDDDSAGCGCAYPDSVSDIEVARSNQILQQLRRISLTFPVLRARLDQLPMHAVAHVGDARIGIVHGDAESLSGWQFDVDALDEANQHDRLEHFFSMAEVDGFASSHTCAPALREFTFANRNRWIINNGAAGMPNFRDTQFGLLTRISTRPARTGSALYGIKTKDVFVDALPINYSQTRWRDEFLANWPTGSAAYESYGKRILSGPDFSMAQAKPRQVDNEIRRLSVALRRTRSAA